MKNQWLHLNTLDSISAVERLVDFYLTEHNTRLPHSAFDGQMPDERYFGTGYSVAHNLKEARAAARRARMKTNRALSCSVWEERE